MIPTPTNNRLNWNIKMNIISFPLKTPIIAPSIRTRRTPFSHGVEKAGVESYTVYNHMLLASQIGDLVQDYYHLKQHVQIWDVAVQRQVRIQGPDTKKLMHLLSPRDITKMSNDQCFYMPLVDRNGGMLNDPVALKIQENEYWISIADSDYLLYALGVADGLDLDVQIDEPDISPLAVQGPKAEELMCKVFGPEVRNIKFFRYKKLYFEGREMVIARSGYSKQGGFEIYVDGFEYGMPLWEKLLADGEDLNVKVGCPNLIERIEGGLLSYGNDMTRNNTPFEAGLGKFINSKENFIGKISLANRPFTKRIMPIEIAGEIPPCDRHWNIFSGGQCIGQVSSAVYSPDFRCNVAIGIVNLAIGSARTKVEVETHFGMRNALICPKFWI
jgi:dimethylsulfoniopropionate demethylase